MKLILHPKRISYFEEHMGLYPDWMHTYSFGKNIFTRWFLYFQYTKIMKITI